MLVKPISRPLVSPVGDPLRNDALPWDAGIGGGGAAAAYYPTDSFRDVWDLARNVTLSGADVDSVLSVGAGANLLAATAGNRPLFNASDANFAGEPSMTFDGGTEWIRALTLDCGTTVSQMSIFIVLKIDTPVNNDAVCQYGDNTTNIRVSQTTGPVLRLQTFGSTGNATSTGTTNISTPRCVGVTWTAGGNQSVWNTSTPEDTDANTRAAFADDLQFTFAASATGTITGAYTTPMICVTPRVLSLAEITAFCAYATARFGL